MPTRSNGAEVEDVMKGSLGTRCGILPGDRLVTVNGHRVADLIDLMFFGADSRLDLVLERGGKRFAVSIRNDADEPGNLGIVLKHFKIRTCRNKCLFCFVSQLPKGLRRSLYVKDEDYRMSFLYGNYVTLLAGGVVCVVQAVPPFDARLDRVIGSATVGSAFWTWLVAVSASQAVWNRSLSLGTRVGLAGLAGLALFSGLVVAFSWVSGWLPPLSPSV